MKEEPLIEYLARTILDEIGEICKDDFKKAESPDWIEKNNKIGIEVTVSNDSLKFSGLIENVKKISDINNINNFNKTYKKCGGSIIDDKKAKMLNIKYSYPNLKNGYVYIPPKYDDTFKPINDRIKSKLKKLNDVYHTCSENWLFIFSPKLVDKEEIDEETEKICEIQNEYKIKYDNIFMLCCKTLYKFNIYTKKCDETSIKDFDNIFKIAIIDQKSVRK